MKIFKKKKPSKKTKEVNNKKNNKNKNEITKFKEQYFSFYDDIKDYTRGKEDW